MFQSEPVGTVRYIVNRDAMALSGTNMLIKNSTIGHHPLRVSSFLRAICRLGSRWVLTKSATSPLKKNPENCKKLWIYTYVD